MYNIKIILLLSLSLNFIFLTECNSVINQLTMSRSILHEIFFKEVKNNRELINFDSKSAQYNTTRCLLGLQKIATDFPSLKVFPFVDAWGTLPSGLLFLNFVSIGNFDQCVRISTKLSDEVGVVNGQHCFLSIPLTPQSNYLTRIAPIENLRDTPFSLSKLKIGICIPNSCSPHFLSEIFQGAIGQTLNGTLSGVAVEGCQVMKKTDFNTVNIIAITIFSTIGTLMLASTLYDITMKYMGETPNSLFIAFSIISNGRKVFAINTARSRNTIDCLSGMRVLSMVWVIYCHVYLFGAAIPTVNYIDGLAWYTRVWSMLIINATVSVDTFLLISGLLVAWMGLAELNASDGKINVLKMYIHRYIRLTPAVAALILYMVGVDNLIGFGPFREQYTSGNKLCTNNWWITLLYIQNYLHPNEICAGHTWYLAVDFQLYVLSPLVLIPMRKWGKHFSPVLVVAALLSISCVIATYFTKGYTGLTMNNEENAMKLIYFPTHTRYSVWLVGFGLGYFMYTHRDKSLTLTKPIQLLGWIISLGTICAIIFGPLGTVRAGNNGTVLEAAMYNSLKRVSWAIALSWIIFTCHIGYGGIVNSILSHPLWQPFQRLSYSLYLVHWFVINIYFGTMRTHNFFSDFEEISHFWAVFGMSINAAIIFTLSFEAPVLALEKILLHSKSRKTESKSLLCENNKELPFSANQKSA